jgi:predicted kinase
VVLSSDRLRKEVAGLDPRRCAAAPYGEGIYDPEHTRRAYGELLRQARLLLELGESVVLDASWSGTGHREQARTLAAETCSELTELCCSAAEQVVRERLDLRRAERRLAGDYSDAGSAVSAAMVQHFAAWPEAVAVDTHEPPEVLADRVARWVQPAGVTYATPRPRSKMGPG